MADSIGFLLLLQVLLIGLNAVFASAEIAVLSINEAKLEHMAEEGSKPAKRLHKLTREPARFLATIQVAITLSGFLGSAFAADNFSEPLVDWALAAGIPLPAATLDTIAVVLITLILSYFTLIFGELVPKRLAMQRSESIAMGISGLVSGISVVFRPIVWFLSVSTNLVLRLCGVDPNQAEDQVSEEEIRMLVDAGSEKGTIDHHEKEFIENVFAFNDTIAGDIATHRTDLVALWLEDDDDTWAQVLHENRHTRFPICDGSPDNVVGILNAKDYFRLTDKGRENVLAHAVRPPYFVPESIKADVLFRNMKEARVSLAVIIDEYGGMVGIVTLYDLIEELVGKLNEEPGSPAEEGPAIRALSEVSWEVTGNLPLRELEQATGLDLPDEDYGTLTGLVFDALGGIPTDGDQDIVVDIDRLRVQVNRIEGHQLEASVVTLLPAEAE